MNVLPIAMTVINIIAGVVYTKGFPVKEKVQLFVMAAVFLVLLYDSPAGLVLYWTLNNVFSLGKNVVQKIPFGKQLVRRALVIAGMALAVFVLFFHPGALTKRLIIAASGVTLAAFSAFPLTAMIKAAFSTHFRSPAARDSAVDHRRTFVAASVTLALLLGLVIPAALVASSVGEFSFVAPYTSPLPFLCRTMIQASGFCIFWPVCIYALFGSAAKKFFAALVTIAAFVALANTFAFNGNYGTLSTGLEFSNLAALRSFGTDEVVNLIVLIAVIGVSCFLLVWCKKAVLYAVQAISVVALVTLGLINITKINSDFVRISANRGATDDDREMFAGQKAIRLSKNGPNVVIIMLDRAIAGHVAPIFAEKPELTTAFAGFTFYPNCISFGGHTIFGAPALFGGYDYTPAAIQKRAGEALAAKNDEALMVLPAIFADAGYTVTLTDLPWAAKPVGDDVVTILDDTKTPAAYLSAHPGITATDTAVLFLHSLIRFSFFKAAPPIARAFLYDNGDWLVTADFAMSGRAPFNALTLANYAELDCLPDLTAVSETASGAYSAIVNNLVHEPGFFQAPAYDLAPITSVAPGLLPTDKSYHAGAAAYTLIGKWCDYLRAADVYDNTRIIIASDHGYGDIKAMAPHNLRLPNKEPLHWYQAVLMVKDFGGGGAWGIDDTFMTLGDIAGIATKNIIRDAVNPYTGNSIKSEKADGVTITTNHLSRLQWHHKTTFAIGADGWLQVRGNIFDPDNWTEVSKP